MPVATSIIKPGEKTMTQDQFQIIIERLDRVDKQLDNVDQRLDNVDKRLDNVDQGLDNIDRDVKAVDSKLELYKSVSDDYKESAKWVLNLAFTVIVAAAVTVIIKAVLGN
jgi:archaellum component FlaC